MDTTRIDGGDPTQRQEVDLPAEPFRGLLLLVRGAAVTGEQANKADLGRFRIKRSGEQLHGATGKHYVEYSDLNRGFPTFTGGDGAGQFAVMPIPFGVPGLPNVMDVATNEEADAILDFSQGNLSTVFGSNAASYELIGLVAPRVSESYTLNVTEQTIQAQGAGTLTGEFNFRNLHSLFLDDVDDVVEDVQIKVDGDIVQDTVQTDTLRALTNLQNEVESQGLDLLEIYEPDVNSLDALRNERVSYSITFSGPGSAVFTGHEVRFNEEAIRRSRSRVQRIGQQSRQAARPGVPAGAVQ